MNRTLDAATIPDLSIRVAELERIEGMRAMMGISDVRRAISVLFVSSPAI
jgi:hypothetical protein